MIEPAHDLAAVAAAFLLFQRACDEERATAEMISRLAALLRRRGNGAAG